jgi:RimJ/RimL family protein N-acetyltransferase
MVTLETERLTLRMPTEQDFEAYAKMLGDPEVMRYIGDGKPLTRPFAWRNLALMIGHWHLRGYGLWTVVERASGEVVGRIGCWNPEGWPGFEVGWTLRRASWGKGYATEGAGAALRFAFERAGQLEVISCIHPDNAPSVRVAGRLGECLRERVEILGTPALVFHFTKDKWEAS